MADDKTLPGDSADAIDRTLTPIFEHARGLRNQGGIRPARMCPPSTPKWACSSCPASTRWSDQLLAHLRSRA